MFFHINVVRRQSERALKGGSLARRLASMVYGNYLTRDYVSFLWSMETISHATFLCQHTCDGYIRTSRMAFFLMCHIFTNIHSVLEAVFP
jgi:hypothetical protein